MFPLRLDEKNKLCQHCRPGNTKPRNTHMLFVLMQLLKIFDIIHSTDNNIESDPIWRKINQNQPSVIMLF